MATAAADEIREFNVRYHDLAASDYDAKWGIGYGASGRAQVWKAREGARAQRVRFGRSLEIGAGTGYFTLNLMRAGVIREAVATDISPGMLEALRRRPTPRGRGEDGSLRGRPLPFADESFDLVFGTRCSTTCPTSTPPSPSSGACCGRAGRWSSAASPRATAT